MGHISSYCVPRDVFSSLISWNFIIVVYPYNTVLFPFLPPGEKPYGNIAVVMINTFSVFREADPRSVCLEKCVYKPFISFRFYFILVNDFRSKQQNLSFEQSYHEKVIFTITNKKDERKCNNVMI